LNFLLSWVYEIFCDDKVSVNFFNGGVIGEQVLLIEAISKDGRIGYQEKSYPVIP